MNISSLISSAGPISHEMCLQISYQTMPVVIGSGFVTVDLDILLCNMDVGFDPSLTHCSSELWLTELSLNS